MTVDTLAEGRAGRHEPASREDLHAALDTLLDAADADGGWLDAPAFWGFVAALGRGRGIAEDIAGAAVRHMADGGALPDNPAEDPARALAAARMAQWAMLAALVRGVSEYPGEIVPREFQAPWFIAAADNIVAGRGGLGGGEHMDLLGLGTQRGKDWHAERRAAKRLILGAVHYRAELTGRTVAEVRGEMLPDVPDRTWKGWTREVARAKRVPVEQVGNDAREAARRGGSGAPYDMTAADVARLMRTAWWPT